MESSDYSAQGGTPLPPSKPRRARRIIAITAAGVVIGSLVVAEVIAGAIGCGSVDPTDPSNYSTSFAVRAGALRSNPVRDVGRLEGQTRQARALTPQECLQWLHTLDNDPAARAKDLPDLTRFLLGTGVRLGEALGVHWDDVNFDRGIVHIRRTVVQVAGQGLIAKAPKTLAGERVLCMPGWLTGLLRARRQVADPDAPIFPDSIGGYRDRNNVERAFRRARAGTPFEWVVPHVYRKTVATMLDHQGLSARIVADQLGHSRISMTQDVYMGRRAVDGMAAAALEGLFDSAAVDDGPGGGART